MSTGTPYERKSSSNPQCKWFKQAVSTRWLTPVRTAQACSILMLTAGLLAACGGGNDSAPAPVVELTASKTSIAAGEPVTLTWSAPADATVRLSGLDATPRSSAVVAPATTTTYELQAALLNGQTVTRNIVVNVNPATPIASVGIDLAGSAIPVPRDYLGFSHPNGQAQLIMGDPQIGVNPIYRQLLKNISDLNGKPVVLRIGGGAVDSTGAPNAGTVRPFARLYQDMQAVGVDTPFIMGLNMALNDPNLAAVQAKQYLQDMPSGSVTSLQLGNEPDLSYSGRSGRPSTYNFSDYMTEFDRFTSQIYLDVPGAPRFVAPSMAFFAQDPAAAVAARGKPSFMTPEDLGRFLMQHGRSVDAVGQHAYYGISSNCGFANPKGTLLKPEASTKEAALVVPYAQVAAAAGKPYRLDETNSIACEGEEGVSNAFEESLWAPDTLFEYLKAGVSGVNLITKNWNRLGKYDPYAAFTFNVPQAQHQNLTTIAAQTWAPGPDIRFSDQYSIRTIHGLYYGMLLFAEATAGQAKMLPVNVSTSANVKAWAVQDSRTGTLNLLIINKDTVAAGSVEASVPSYRTGVAKRMRAPSFSALTGITLAGQTFDGSADGKPVGTRYGESVSVRDGKLTVALEPTSAVLVTLSK